MSFWIIRRAHVREADLSAYLDGALDAREAAAAEAHLRDCPRCSHLLEEMSAVRSMLGELPRQQPSRSFLISAAAAGRAAAAPRPATRGSWLVAAPALSLALLAALLVVDFAAVDSGNEASLTNSDAAIARPMTAAGAPQTEAPPAASDQPQAARAAPEQAPAAPQPPPAPSPGPNIFAAPSAADANQGVDRSFSSSASVSPESGKAATESPAAQDVPSEDGTDWLRVLQVLAAFAFVVSAGALVWVRLTARGAA